MVGQRGRGEGQECVSGTTPLVVATVRFLEEFVYEERKSPPPQQQATRGKAREEEEEKKGDDGVDSFIPTYVYDAMKEKKRFDNMRVRFRAHVAPFCY
jgi:ubiquitin carboxyl-terminal hydrolase 10